MCCVTLVDKSIYLIQNGVVYIHDTLYEDFVVHIRIEVQCIVYNINNNNC